MDGPWQAGHCTAIEYAARALASSNYMKGLDPTIQTVICGSSGRAMATYMEWDRTILQECWETADFISAHRYSRNLQNDTPWFLAEGVEIDRVLSDYAGLIDYVRGLKRSEKRVYLSFDEWNVWYRHRGPSENGNWKEAPHILEEVYNVEDAIVCAQYLAAFIRRADLVKVACIAQIVNVIAPIMTKTDGILVQSIYHPFELISKNANGLSLRPSIDGPTYKAGDRGDAPVIDAAASFDPATGEASVFVTNRKIDDAATVTVAFSDRVVTKILSGEGIGGQDPKLFNSWENATAVARFSADAKVVDGGVQIPLKAPGFAAVKMATKQR
jgi:alpha-N-arabinofuranosidase